MSKIYAVEVQFAKTPHKWTLLANYTKQVDAMHYVKERIEESSYPLRIVRIERKTVFESK